MRRTYFVPLCVVGGFFLAAGIGMGILGATTGYPGFLDKLDQAWQAEYQRPHNYNVLFNEAWDLRQKNSRDEKEHYETGISYLTVLGAVLVGWGFDRRRLVRKLNELAPQVKEERP